jgi:hypothetical protein
MKIIMFLASALSALAFFSIGFLWEKQISEGQFFVSFGVLFFLMLGTTYLATKSVEKSVSLCLFYTGIALFFVTIAQWDNIPLVAHDDLTIIHAYQVWGIVALLGAAFFFWRHPIAEE